MHILILSPSFPTFSKDCEGDFYGGSFVLAEALAYNSAGAKVTILTPHAPGLPLKEVIRDGLEVFRFCYFFPISWQKVRIPKLPLYTTKLLWWRIFQFPFFILAFCLSISRFIHQIDVIHANWTITALIAIPYKFIFKIPIVLTVRGTDLKLIPDFVNRFIFRKVSGIFDVWSGIGRAGKYRQIFPGRYVKLPLITRTNIEKPNQKNKYKKNNTFQFTFIGRLFVQDVGRLKGVNILIPASKRLRERYSNFEVHIVGDGPSMDLIERQCHEFRVEKYVKIHGYHENVFPFIFNSDAVIGGLGLNAVVQESAYCEALLILPDISEWCGDIWKHKKNAILYKPRDPDALADAMAFVIECPNECHKIASKGFETIHNYVVDIARGGRIYTDVFGKIIEEIRKT
jgi:glycosyltransferase involved in cell wall biosynthesis